jgi:hypothetical protein
MSADKGRGDWACARSINPAHGVLRCAYSIWNGTMNHHHRKTLHALFAHPISANIDLKKVLHVFEELGAEIENSAGNRVKVKLNDHTAAFVHAQHSLPKDEVVQIKKFLEQCGVTPERYPL